jgi:hypothetical protein
LRKICSGIGGMKHCTLVSSFVQEEKQKQHAANRKGLYISMQDFYRLLLTSGETFKARTLSQAPAKFLARAMTECTHCWNCLIASHNTSMQITCQITMLSFSLTPVNLTVALMSKVHNVLVSCCILAANIVPFQCDCQTKCPWFLIPWYTPRLPVPPKCDLIHIFWPCRHMPHSDNLHSHRLQHQKCLHN